MNQNYRESEKWISFQLFVSFHSQIIFKAVLFAYYKVTTGRNLTLRPKVIKDCQKVTFKVCQSFFLPRSEIKEVEKGPNERVHFMLEPKNFFIQLKHLDKKIVDQKHYQELEHWAQLHLTGLQKYPLCQLEQKLNMISLSLNLYITNF